MSPDEDKIPKSFCNYFVNGIDRDADFSNRSARFANEVNYANSLIYG